MKVKYADDDLKKLYEDPTFRISQYGPDVTKQFRKKVGLIMAARDQRDIRHLASLHLEKLTNDPEGRSSIRLNKQWRLTLRFEVDADGQHVIVLAITDYH